MKEEDSYESRVVAGGARVALPPRAELPEDSGDPNQRYFSTEHLLTNLKHRTVSSGFITLASQGAKFALTTASTIILGRLLDPKDYGLIGMVTAIMGLLRMFRDAGLSAATIQSESITHAQVSNLFWINVAFGAFLASLLAVSAPAIAWFNHQPRLVGIALWLSVTFLLNCSTVQHQALLRRQMRFKAIAVIEVGSISASLMVGVIMAKMAFGYWSLVGMYVTLETTAFILTWFLARWRPQWPKRNSGTRPLLRFGVGMTAGGVCYAVTKSLDSILIGKCYGDQSLGFYSRALALLAKPLDQLLGPVSAVFMPTLSRLQSEPARYRRVFLQVYQGMALAGFGFGALILALSHPITLALLGPKWEGAAPIFAAFSVAALHTPIASATVWLLISQGRGKDFVRWNVAFALVTIAAYFAGLPFGPFGVALACSVSNLVILFPFLCFLAGRIGPVNAKDLWFGFLPHLPLAAAVGGAAFLAHRFVAAYSPWVQLLICVPVGLLSGLATVLVVKPQREVANSILQLVRGMVIARLNAAAK